MSTNTFTTTGMATDGLARIEEIKLKLGGHPVLLPINRGCKRPACERWQETTVQQHMSDPAYLNRFNGTNIGVLLGKASGNLCSIDIDTDGDVDAFVALNPALAGTLRTRGSRGANFWVRVEGEYPTLTKLKTNDNQAWGEWRADGGQTVIYGLHPSGNEYSRIVDASPVELSFDEIVWPEQLTLPWRKTPYDQLVDRFGLPYTLGKSGGVSISQMFFVGKFADERHVLFEGEEQQFYAYNEDNGLWELKSDHWIKAELAKDLKSAADSFEQPTIATMATDNLTTALKNMLKGQTEKHGVFKKQPNLIHVKNGVLDIGGENGEVLSFSPEHYSRNQIPIEFDENATCPRFEQELLCPALDDQDISLFQRWCGSVLLGVNDAQRLMILCGEGGTGKSTLAAIVESVIGQTNVAQLRTKQLAERFELAGCIGKTLLTGKDVAGNFLNTDGSHMIKALCGGDMVEAEIKRGGRVQVKGVFNILITSNSRLWLKLDGDTGAWQRRLLIIEFNKKRTSKTVPDLANKLIAEEGPGILNFMLEGAMLLKEELKEHGGYVLTDDQNARIERLVSESDSVRSFVRQCVSLATGAQVTTDALVDGYVRYCQERGWHPLSTQAVERQLPEAMLQIHHLAKRNDVMTLGGSMQRGYVGARLGKEGLCR